MHPNGKRCLRHFSRCKLHNSLSRVLLVGGKSMAVQFKKQNADDETCALVSIDEGVIANDADDVGNCEIDDIRGIAVGVKLLGPGKRGFEKSLAAYSRSTSVERKQAIVER